MCKCTKPFPPTSSYATILQGHPRCNRFSPHGRMILVEVRPSFSAVEKGLAMWDPFQHDKCPTFRRGIIFPGLVWTLTLTGLHRDLSSAPSIYRMNCLETVSQRQWWNLANAPAAESEQITAARLQTLIWSLLRIFMRCSTTTNGCDTLGRVCADVHRTVGRCAVNWHTWNTLAVVPNT